jgi:hypothetical protein
VDKKPLIGVSICAVVLLVLGSLSNVVGYQSVKSTVNDSPLFQTRTQRAMNHQQDSITSKYLGMEKGILLQFPFRDNRTEQLKKIVELISKMDEKTFARFTKLCIQRIRQDKSVKDMNPDDVVKALTLLKTTPVSIIDSFIKKNNQFFSASGLVTICDYFQGCILSLIIIIILNTLFILLLKIVYTYVPSTMGC